jgi:hypothetical protein
MISNFGSRGLPSLVLDAAQVVKFWLVSFRSGKQLSSENNITKPSAPQAHGSNFALRGGGPGLGK